MHFNERYIYIKYLDETWNSFGEAIFNSSHNLPSRVRIKRNSTALLSRIISNYNSAWSPFWMSCLLLSLFHVANAWNSASFPFHRKYAHSTFWYLGSVLSTYGIRSCCLDVRCQYSFSITNAILGLVISLSDYSQHFGDKLRLFLVKTDSMFCVSLHPASHNKLAQ